MTRTRDTQSDLNLASGSDAEARQAGLVWIFSGDQPTLWPEPLRDGKLVVGRDTLGDERVSRQHAEVTWGGAEWRVRDLGSRNGTFVDGRAVDGSVAGAALALLRVGRSLGLLCRDLDAYKRPIATGAQIVGPTLARTFDAVGRAAASGRNLLVVGESGVGKELAARHFHGVGPRAGGPFVAVNCAAIPHGIAERLLFGAKRGAYSGADADAPGHVQAANHGVLFLDEIAELDAAVQAKLLRLLESREVLPLGSSAARPADVAFCFATHRNLRAAVAQGTLRADLYYRIADPAVTIPPLRERREEVPWLVAAELARADGRLRAHATLIEACVRRPWPGNVRELLGAVRAAAERATVEGKLLVQARHLPADAGAEIVAAGAPSAEPSSSAGPPSAAAIEAALTHTGGNVAAAARALGLHRTQLYRLMVRLGLRGTTP